MLPRHENVAIASFHAFNNEGLPYLHPNASELNNLFRAILSLLALLLFIPCYDFRL